MAIRKELVDAKCDTGQTHTFQTPAFFTFKLFYNPEILQKSDDPANIPEIIFRKYAEPNEDGKLPPVDESEKQIIAPLDKNLHEEVVTDEKTGKSIIEYILTRVSKNHYTMSVPTDTLKEYFNSKEFSILYDPKIDQLPVYIYHKLDSTDPYTSVEDIIPKPKLKEPYYEEGDEDSDESSSSNENSNQTSSDTKNSDKG